MIPKIIHFCWFGGNPLPPLALECIASWRKYLPEYEIWQWSEESFDENDNVNEKNNENNNDKVNGNRNDNDNRNVDAQVKPDRIMGFDVNLIPYTAEAYKQKKYAFVSDYARFWIMYKYGGVYFDTDVEVIKTMDDIIAKGSFAGYEKDPDGKNYGTVALGLGFALTKEHYFMKSLLDYYAHLSFEIKDGKVKTIVGHTTDLLISQGLTCKPGMQDINGLTIYPAEYFCPIHNVTKRLHITDNTRSIHRYMDSWNENKKSNLKDRLREYIPEWLLLLINRIKN